MCARNYHSYTHLILALCIVREPTVWGFMTSTSSSTQMSDVGRAAPRPGPLGARGAPVYSCPQPTFAVGEGDRLGRAPS